MGRSPTDDPVEALKEATREAHEVLKDLNAVVKEARELRTKLPDTTKELIEHSITHSLTAYQASLLNAIDAAHAAIQRRFDTLADRYFGDKRKRGEPTLEELIVTQQTLDWLGERKEREELAVDVSRRTVRQRPSK